MPKKDGSLGAKRRTGKDKAKRTFDLYGKMRPTREGDSRVFSSSVSSSSGTAGKKKKKGPRTR